MPCILFYHKTKTDLITSSILLLTSWIKNYTGAGSSNQKPDAIDSIASLGVRFQNFLILWFGERFNSPSPGMAVNKI